MESHLPGAVADLLAHGLAPDDIAHLMRIPIEDVAKLVAGEEPPSLNVPGAIRVGMAIYSLEDLKKRQLDSERLALLLRADICLIVLEEALHQP